VQIDPEVLEEVRHNDHVRQTQGCEPLDEHHDLIRLKVAEALALLGKRADLSGDDWVLAGQVTDLSRAVRASALRRVTELGAEQERGYREKLAGRAVATDDAVRTRRVVETAKAIAERTYVTKDWTVRDARHAIRREPEIFDLALAHAVAEEWVVEVEEPSHTDSPKRALRPGPKRPR
jgi:hypothetical protein